MNVPQFCFTVDLDRDVNIPVPGQRGAGSIDRGRGTAPRFASSERGLVLMSELLDGLSLKATFFAEGRTLLESKDSAGCLCGHEVGCHGWDHEDFTALSEEEARESVSRSKNTVKDITGTYPKSFRAPYMKPSDRLFRLLSEYGFETDSSAYAGPEGTVPYETDCGITEVPVLRTADVSGTVRTSYLWPVHEGKRTADRFLELSENIPDDGVLVICDHSWHLIESRVSGTRSEESVNESLAAVRKILETLSDRGFVPRTVSGLSPCRRLYFTHAR